MGIVVFVVEDSNREIIGIYGSREDALARAKDEAGHGAEHQYYGETEFLDGDEVKHDGAESWHSPKNGEFFVSPHKVQ